MGELFREGAEGDEKSWPGKELHKAPDQVNSKQGKRTLIRKEGLQEPALGPKQRVPEGVEGGTK